MRNKIRTFISNFTTVCAASFVVSGSAEAAQSGDRGSQGKASKKSEKKSATQTSSSGSTNSGSNVVSEANPLIDRVLRYVADAEAFNVIVNLSAADQKTLANLPGSEIQTVLTLNAAEIKTVMGLSADDRSAVLAMSADDRSKVLALSEADRSTLLGLSAADQDNFFDTGVIGPSNPLLAEATITANKILRDFKPSASFSLSSSDAYTYDTLFPNAYNKELIKLLARASNSDGLVDAINTFVANRDVEINNQTLLSQIFKEDGENTDLLGLRKLSYISPTKSHLNYTFSQGEAYLRKNITLSGVLQVDGIEMDVSETILKEAANTQKTSRLFSVAALGEMNVSGKITVKNSNSNAATTRNVMVIGAIGAMKIADNSTIVNEGRILAVGAGKLRGFDGGRVKGLELESQGSIVVGSGKDLNLENAKFKVGQSKQHLVMYAQDTMTVKNPTFSGFRPNADIYMEAITVNLSNVDFPDGTKVKLVSRDGGTANGSAGTGIYPHFGSSQPGRVNFISNVSYNSNVINSTATFDQYGSQIKISKLK